jgi:hypothetical protein
MHAERFSASSSEAICICPDITDSDADISCLLAIKEPYGPPTFEMTQWIRRIDVKRAVDELLSLDGLRENLALQLNIFLQDR